MLEAPQPCRATRSFSAVGTGEWEADAENWVRWARSPDDAYWHFRDSFFDSILPSPGQRTLEIGCGEGRVARDLVVRGHRVTAVDTADALVRAARVADRTGRYLVAGGESLPFAPHSFDLVVAYNSLQVVADMVATVEETARVLAAGGCLCFCVAHPVTDLGRFVTDEAGATYALRTPYFERTRVDDTVERNGLTMTFRGWTYTLEEYASALAASGLVIDAIREPRPDSSTGRHGRWTQIPLFMNVRAVKRQPTGGL